MDWSVGSGGSLGTGSACSKRCAERVPAVRSSVRVVHGMVSEIVPFDDMEAEHQLEIVRWLESTDDVYRRAKPDSPNRHLVSYIPVVDPGDGSSLLVSHINAGRWLPPGGHVEPDENPVDAARREADEELGVKARFVEHPPRPAFVTVTVTGGIDRGHTDVSLWFPLLGSRDMDLSTDLNEFTSTRWWTPAEVQAAPPEALDPHYVRFARKLGI